MYVVRMCYSFQERKGAVARARGIYQQGCRFCSSSSALWLLAVRLEERTAGVTKARSILEVARMKNMTDELLWLESVRLEVRNDSEKLAETMMSRALQACPNSGLLLAEDIALAPRPAKKRKARDAMARCENDPHVVLAVAKVFWWERKHGRTRKWLQRAVTLDPDFGDAWAWLLRYMQAHGTPEEVEAVVQQCHDAEPRHGEAWCAVSKSSDHRRKKTKELLHLVAASLPEIAKE